MPQHYQPQPKLNDKHCYGESPFYSALKEATLTPREYIDKLPKHRTRKRLNIFQSRRTGKWAIYQSIISDNSINTTLQGPYFTKQEARQRTINHLYQTIKDSN